MKLTKELAESFELDDPVTLKVKHGLLRSADWWGLRKADLETPPDYYLAFQAAKGFVRDHLEFRVVAFNDDQRGVTSHVAEVYADAVLQAEYGDFSTS